jgi:hypothetical protein
MVNDGMAAIPNTTIPKPKRDLKHRPGVLSSYRVEKSGAYAHMRLFTGKGGTETNKISTKSENGRGKFVFSTSKPGLKIL